ncbi:MAG TPA: hypothetical protein VJT81_07390 [Burkholderiales bacterium]|nr:hypothetical protein [Burkholderiales bacterium]
MSSQLILRKRNPVDLFLVSHRAFILIMFAFASPVWADVDMVEKKAVDDAMKTMSSDCEVVMGIDSGVKLTYYNTLRYMSNEVLTSLEKMGLSANADIEQVRVRLSDGREYFLVRAESTTFKCKTPHNLPGEIRAPIETLTDFRLKINPCCTYSFGGDAFAQWAVGNCPFMKPRVIANSICGR